MRLVRAFFLSSLGALAACAAPTAEEPAAEQAEELVSNLPSRACGAVARKAALALEEINGGTARVARTELVAGHSDRELVRVSIKRSSWRGTRDSYLVNTESMGGSPCYVYGLQVKSEQMDLTDDGKVIGEPSVECRDVAFASVKALATINGRPVTILGAELADGFSDKELVRVKVESGGAKDSYLVSTESMGGSPCYVYGISLASEEMPLLDE